MQPTSPSTLYNWQKGLLSEIKPGELTVFAAARQTGKSMMSKYLLNSVYGKMGIMESVVEQLTITKAYKGEWKVELPWGIGPRQIFIAEFDNWCIETFGPCGLNRKYRWRKANTKYRTYFFRDESDLTLLTLRWR